MSKVNGNTMNLKHLQDFYFLEAMSAGIASAKSSHPEFSFRRSVERLETDIEVAMSEISHNIALRLYAYLWMTLLGEARHADSMCKDYIKQLRNADRNTVYCKSLDFFPNDHNTEIITHIYTQKWSSGSFGGQAWLDIAEGMKMYGKVSHATFIDHAVDLEHNGGTVFSKGGSYVNLDTSYAGQLKDFLGYKFEKDILNDKPYWTNNLAVTRRVYALLVRYNNVIAEIQAVNYTQPRLEKLTHFEIEWEYNELELVEGRNEVTRRYDMHCEKCGAYKVNSSNHEHINGMCVCDRCYNRRNERREELNYCENCGRNTRHDVIWIDGESENWCSTCVENYSTQCENCHYDKHVNNTVYSEDYITLCDDCAKEHTCELCNEVHYNDMDEHDAENHYEPAILNDDAEGVFETEQDFSWIPETVKTEVGYQWAGSRLWHTCEAVNAQAQAKIFEDMGAKTYIKTTKTFTPCNKRQQTEVIYDSGKGLFVYQLENGKHVIMTPCMLYAKNTSKGTLNENLDIMYKMLEVIDWTKIETTKDWQSLPSETIRQIKHAVYGG
jgi:hypothetical protein